MLNVNIFKKRETKGGEETGKGEGREGDEK
jgi:hypothetical protein